jgi:hypothetical protein
MAKTSGELEQEFILILTMPRISHMVVVYEQKQLDEQVSGYIRESYNRSHKK